MYEGNQRRKRRCKYIFYASFAYRGYTRLPVNIFLLTNIATFTILKLTLDNVFSHKYSERLLNADFGFSHSLGKFSEKKLFSCENDLSK